MKHVEKFVCTECGHSEIRALAPLYCPVCDCAQVTADSEHIEDELTEDELETIFKRAAGDE